MAGSGGARGPRGRGGSYSCRRPGDTRVFTRVEGLGVYNEDCFGWGSASLVSSRRATNAAHIKARGREGFAESAARKGVR